jgi:hypothetical protein
VCRYQERAVGPENLNSFAYTTLREYPPEYLWTEDTAAIMSCFVIFGATVVYTCTC